MCRTIDRFSKGLMRPVHALRPLDAKGQRDKTTLEATVLFGTVDLRLISIKAS